ncbi:polysaccharide deacetylase [Paenibacillus curdlanolyticus YK9]|uniref:Polysaccharide deacetylase n=1 Tax=Paenibacillus curdlanolyticus YK9 TaxID=717606 RepID=E0IAV8_9BACL|nr:polysaccharide deacetylase family protein [Paenibacillus curdlanolyticus]EFM10249.1 polysaccharide deacetylase [Paenibacillus curdlanolyticus YK9]
MIRRRIVRAVYAMVIAVSAAAFSGWFVDQGEASGELGGSEGEQVYLSAPAATANGNDAYVLGSANTASTANAANVADIKAASDSVEPIAIDEAARTTTNSSDRNSGSKISAVTVSVKAVGGTVVEPPQQAQPADKTVYLTFDDGPSKLTGQVLDILKKNGIHATFFVLGEQVEAHPELLKRIVAEGHTVGNHTYDHVYKELYSGFGEFAKQIVRTETALQEAAGIRTKLVRAPGGTFGNFDQSYFDAMKGAGYTLFDWTVDSGDSVRIGVPASEIVSNVHQSKLSHETIVLLHDSQSHAESVKALPEIIHYYKSKGYSFAALSEQVKPVTFRLSDKLKWSRPKATASDRELVGRGIVQEHGAEPFVFSGERAGGAAVDQQLLELVVLAGERSIVFAPDSFAKAGDDWQVPLRNLVEGIGGSVSWDVGQRAARVTFANGERYEVRADDKAGIELRGGVMYAPLLAVLKQFGIATEPNVS